MVSETRPETVTYYDRRGLKPGELGRETEAPLIRRAGQQNVLAFAAATGPLAGYEAVYWLDAAPWIVTVPVVAWGVVQSFEVLIGEAGEFREVEALVIEEGRLESVYEAGNFLGLVGEDDQTGRERMRTEAERRARTAEQRSGGGRV